MECSTEPVYSNTVLGLIFNAFQAWKTFWWNGIKLCIYIYVYIYIHMCIYAYICILYIYVSAVQFSSVAQSCLTLRNSMNCSRPGLPVHHQIPEFTQTCVHWVGDAIQPSHPLLSPSPSALNPSIRVFSNESALPIGWPMYWSFSFNISPSKEYPGLISCRMDWLKLLAVQGTLKSLLQYHSSKPSILKNSAFFIVQFSHHTWLLKKP